MTIRLHAALALDAGMELALPAEAARHAQVRRVQPGDTLRLFDGGGGEWQAAVVSMGRRDVLVRLGARVAATPELTVHVTLAVGVPANERMDTLVEKATELGVAAIQPLICERSVVRLDRERAQRRRLHWQGIAVAACEQCGRATVPEIALPCLLPQWLDRPAGPPSARWLLSPDSQAQPLRTVQSLPAAVLALSGPEGGLTVEEQARARAAGFLPIHLGPRVLRADTAPLVVMAWIGLRSDDVSQESGPAVVVSQP